MHIGALTGFSHVSSPESLITTLLSQGYVLGQLLTPEASRTYIRSTGEGVGSLDLARSSTQQLHLLDDLPQQSKAQVANTSPEGGIKPSTLFYLAPHLVSTWWPR